MAANPIFPLYYNDIDRSTRDWTDEEFGCYMRLLMHQWDKGEIPKDPQRLARIVTSLGSSWVQVGLKFTETEKGYINERLEEIRQERNAFNKKQQENGKKGGRKPKINPNNNPNINPNESLHNEYEIEQEKEVIKRGCGGDLNDTEIGATIEYVKITGQRMLTVEQVVTYWKAYLIHAKGEWHPNRNKQLQHFRNWLKKQPNEQRTPNNRSRAAASQDGLAFLADSLENEHGIKIQ